MYASAIVHLSDVQFQEYLLKLDNDLAAQIRAQGCPDRQGELHAAPFWRKPRGAKVGDNFLVRLSFCCARHGCRHRTTPPSLRFLRPKVFLGAVVVLITAMRCGVTPARMQTLKDLVGVSRQTVLRRQAWWQEALQAKPFWQRAAAQILHIPLSRGANGTWCVGPLACPPSTVPVLYATSCHADLGQSLLKPSMCSIRSGRIVDRIGSRMKSTPSRRRCPPDGTRPVRSST